MVQRKKASSSKGKKPAKPQPSVKKSSPLVYTRGVAAAKAEARTLPLKTKARFRAKQTKPYNPKLDLGREEKKYGEDTLFVLPNGISALSVVIDDRGAGLRKLNREANAIFKQGSVNLFEDTELSCIEHQRSILEQLIAQLLQIKKRAYEIPPRLISCLQVYVEEIRSCPADLIKRRNSKIVLLQPEYAKGQVGLGSLVTIVWLDNGEKKIFLVSSFYTNGIGDKTEVSYASRLAQAAMGESKDAICELEVGVGRTTKPREFRILEVS